MKKRIGGLLLTALLIISSSVSALACTGTIVGKNMSEDGTTFVARTEDIGGGHTKRYLVQPAVQYAKGATFVDRTTGFTYPQPENAYKYTYVPDADVDGDGIYGEIGFNEFGVFVDATVSAQPNELAETADPFVADGFREANIVSILLPRVKTAREGVELLASIVEEKGSAEGNVLVIGDSNETWYVEIYTGHRYAAIKVPDDACMLFPNCFMLGNINLEDTENVIASKDLITFAQQNQFYREYEGKFHAALSYGEELSEGNRQRLWGGQNFLAPSQKVSYNKKVFDLFITPDKKVSLEDIMELQKYRYEGTKLDANLPENSDVREIGTERQAECHILQIKPDYPSELGGIMWLAMGNAEHSIYLPTYGNITSTHPAYQNASLNYSPDSAYWVFRSVATLAELNREKFGFSVREYWTDYQKELIANQKEMDKKVLELYAQDPQKAAEYTTKQGIDIADKAIKNAKTLYEELMTYIAVEGGRPNKQAFVPSIAQNQNK